MEIKERELITVIIIIAIVGAFIISEDKKMNLMVIIGSIIGGLVANLIHESIIKDYVYEHLKK